MEIERGNILAASRFVIRELLDFLSSNQLSVVDFDETSNSITDLSSVVSRLLCTIERAICHGIAPTSIKNSKHNDCNRLPDPWPVICHMSAGFQNLIDSVNLVEDVKTGLGKTRLWIRHAMMNKVQTSIYSLIV